MGMTEKAAYDARFRSAEARFFQHAVQERLNLEAIAGQHYVVPEAEQD